MVCLLSGIWQTFLPVLIVIIPSFVSETFMFASALSSSKRQQLVKFEKHSSTIMLPFWFLALPARACCRKRSSATHSWHEMLWLIIAILMCFVNFVCWTCIDTIFRKWKGIRFDFLRKIQCALHSSMVFNLWMFYFRPLCLRLQLFRVISGVKDVFELVLLVLILLLVYTKTRSNKFCNRCMERSVQERKEKLCDWSDPSLDDEFVICSQDFLSAFEVPSQCTIKRNATANRIFDYFLWYKGQALLRGSPINVTKSFLDLWKDLWNLTP